MSTTEEDLAHSLSEQVDELPGAVTSLAEQVFETIRGQIVRGELPPGYRLRIRDLASDVGTSVMPVREAVKRLVAAGLAVQEPYKGATVRGLDTTELVHAYDVRILLEGEAARLGATAASAQVSNQMYEHWHLLEKAALEGNVEEALRQDELLLGTLYAAATNDILFQVIKDLWDKCRPYRNIWAAQATGEAGITIWRNKPSLIVAARSNDGEAAKAIIDLSYRDAQSAIKARIERDH